MKYITRIGQNTGTLKTGKKVIIMAIITALVDKCQNLNSGNLLMKGLNSAFELFVGRDNPSSSLDDSANAGSILGDKNMRKRLR